ncbi:hypothetical protein [Streptomyces sp. NBC_01803]|uniref:hypothetical protein n=1 Tax=Streptomyces sp. NBC_01803 TaxID=2975946 RepID=UPI002DD7D929|nr:hypothetical protein [Streptomyces sp. NBC_01803]
MSVRTSEEPQPARARHRARSPIIAPGIQPAALTVALAALLAATAPLGQAAALPTVAVLQAVTAAGWFRLNGMWPARQGIALAFAGGLTADAAVLIAGADRATEAMLGVLGVWFLLVVVLQLRHRGSADERLDSLTATAAATLLTGLATGHLAAVDISAAAVAVTAAAAGAATLFRALPGPGAVTAVLALAAAAAAGAAGTRLSDLGTADALAFAAAGGLAALIGLRVASYDFPSRFVHFTAGVALPLTAAAPACYALTRALL